MCKIQFFLAALFAVFVFAGCNPGINSENIDQFVDAVYQIDTANVDYKNDNNIVFYDFSSGTKTVVSHDVWHLAFSGDLNVIANSGNYGSGVSVCSTGVTNFEEDFTSWFSDTGKIFTRIDTNDNVLGRNWMDLSSMPPACTRQVYLLKIKGEMNFKIQFTGAGMGGTIHMKIGTPDEVSADELTFTHNDKYEYTYIDCRSKQTVRFYPKRDAWDIRFGRTEFAMGTMTGGRSSIAINTSGGVQAAVVNGKDIDEVMSAAGLAFEDDMLAIGNEWYEFDHDTKIYSVAKKTYVIKTTENNYAKFQIATFDGPDNQNFWCLFEYMYQDDGAEIFEK